MKFFQKLSPVAWWLLRASVLIFIILRYFNTTKTLNLSSASFYIALTFIVAAVMILVGGFYKQGTLTRVGAMLLCIVGGYLIFVNIHASTDYLSLLILLTSIGFVFLTRKENV